MNAAQCDVVVIGLGAVGSSALYSLAKLGVSAIGVDRFHPPHDHGSSHGESRITRQAIGEGEAYVPLVLRSNQLWEELEHATGEQLIERCGFIYITRDDEGTSHHGKSSFMERTRSAAQRFGIAHELLSSDEIGRRFPQFIGLSGDEQAYYEPGGGYVRPERCIATALDQAIVRGAHAWTGCKVLAVHRSAGRITIQTDRGKIRTEKAILAAGAWIGDLAGPAIANHVSVHRQLLHWFQVEDGSAYRSGASPTFIWTHGPSPLEQFYGFPPIAGLVKVAREDYAGIFDPDDGSRQVDPAEGITMAEYHVCGRIAGVSKIPVRSAVCHYTVTPDMDFLITSEDGIQSVSACSGHGFKHASAVGEAAALRAAGKDPIVDLGSFDAERFNT